MKYAVVETATNTVVNVIELEEGADWSPPEGHTLDPNREMPGPDFTSPPVVSQVQPVLVAQARLAIVGDDIQGIDTAAGFTGAMTLDPNVFWLFFTVPQPDLDYLEFIQVRGVDGAKADFDVTDRTAEYIEVTITDREGEPMVPESLTVSIQRAQ